MTFDPSNSKKGDSSRFASALVEVLEAADAVPRSVEQLGDATAIDRARAALALDLAEAAAASEPRR